VAPRAGLPGGVIPRPVQERLNLNDKQRQRLEELRKNLDTELKKILSADQYKRLQELRQQDPGLPGGPDRPGMGPRGARAQGAPGVAPGAPQDRFGGGRRQRGGEAPGGGPGFQRRPGGGGPPQAPPPPPAPDPEGPDNAPGETE
jgi:hypothetical protein